ncbi:MAG: hypothetical protein R6V85_10570, partial [Polyangia bacterium]
LVSRGVTLTNQVPISFLLWLMISGMEIFHVCLFERSLTEKRQAGRRGEPNPGRFPAEKVERSRLFRFGCRARTAETANLREKPQPTLESTMISIRSV